jgi:hypothetical protein
MNEKENESSFAFGEVEVYRLTRLYRVYHFVVGAVGLVGAVLAHRFFILSILLVLFSAFMISRPLVMAVIVDQLSVTYKELFSEKSIRRSSITAVETKSNGRSHSLYCGKRLMKKGYRCQTFLPSMKIGINGGVDIGI